MLLVTGWMSNSCRVCRLCGCSTMMATNMFFEDGMNVNLPWIWHFLKCTPLVFTFSLLWLSWYALWPSCFVAIMVPMALRLCDTNDSCQCYDWLQLANVSRNRVTCGWHSLPLTLLNCLYTVLAPCRANLHQSDLATSELYRCSCAQTTSSMCVQWQNSMAVCLGFTKRSQPCATENCGGRSMKILPMRCSFEIRSFVIPNRQQSSCKKRHLLPTVSRE